MLTFPEMVAEEIQRARSKYGRQGSLHEGYAILLEEVEELWDEIKKKPSKRLKSTLLCEAVQVGAMVQRLAEDCGLLEG